MASSSGSKRPSQPHGHLKTKPYPLFPHTRPQHGHSLSIKTANIRHHIPSISARSAFTSASPFTTRTSAPRFRISPITSFWILDSLPTSVFSSTKITSPVAVMIGQVLLPCSGLRISSTFHPNFLRRRQDAFLYLLPSLFLLAHTRAYNAGKSEELETQNYFCFSNFSNLTPSIGLNVPMFHYLTISSKTATAEYSNCNRRYQFRNH